MRTPELEPDGRMDRGACLFATGGLAEGGGGGGGGALCAHESAARALFCVDSAIRMKVAQEEAATFTPHINPTSASIAAAVQEAAKATMPLDFGGRLGGAPGKGGAVGGVVDRLSADASLALERRAQRELQRAEAEERACPFKPSINEVSDRLAAEAVASGEAGSARVFERLREAGEQAEERRRAREAQAIEEERALLFKPTTSQANEILLSARTTRLQESDLERTERLAYVDSKRKDAIIAQLQASHFAQYTHRPAIDAISAKLARAKTDDELHQNPAGKALKEHIAKRYEKTASAECTFRPKLDPKSEALAQSRGSSRSAFAPDGVDALSERLAAEKRDRAERLEKARREAEAAALKECTFAPQLNAPSSAAKSGGGGGGEKPLVVKGLGRCAHQPRAARDGACQCAQAGRAPIYTRRLVHTARATAPSTSRATRTHPHLAAARIWPLPAHGVRER